MPTPTPEIGKQVRAAVLVALASFTAVAVIATVALLVARHRSAATAPALPAPRARPIDTSVPAE